MTSKVGKPGSHGSKCVQNHDSFHSKCPMFSGQWHPKWGSQGHTALFLNHTNHLVMTTAMSQNTAHLSDLSHRSIKKYQILLPWEAFRAELIHPQPKVSITKQFTGHSLQSPTGFYRTRKASCDCLQIQSWKPVFQRRISDIYVGIWWPILVSGLGFDFDPSVLLCRIPRGYNHCRPNLYLVSRICQSYRKIHTCILSQVSAKDTRRFTQQNYLKVCSVITRADNGWLGWWFIEMGLAQW
jgi:hypothetical protein